MKLLEKSTDSVPLIFLVTDGAVEDERDICNFVKSYVSSGQSFRTPRIYTFGIGKNSSFLFYLYSSENSFRDIINWQCSFDTSTFDKSFTSANVLSRQKCVFVCVKAKNILKLNLGMF